VALLGVAATAIVDWMPPPGQIVVGASLAFVLVTVSRSGYRIWLTNRRRVGHYLRPVLLVGAGDESADIAALLTEHPELGYRTAAVVGNEREAREHGLADVWYAEVEDARWALSELGVGGAIVCSSDLRPSQLNPTVRELLDAGAHVQLSSGLHSIDIGRLRPSPLAHEPLFYVEHVSLASWQLATKRAIDMVVAFFLLALTAPLLLLAALGIKLQDRGPILFKQSRVGRHGERFACYKLRTMRQDAEREFERLRDLNARDGPLAKIPNDPRVTVLGRVLRATSIDELPQLWNVLNGTMSLVGPRPALPDEVAHFDTQLRAREAVLPGLTGLWQVEGRDNPSFAAYRRFDLFYLQNWSITLDIMILLGTVESIIARTFRALIHRGEEIPLAPPEVRDSEGEANRALRRETNKQWRESRGVGRM
jgi:exopolysaccharide biosynthesis polyprenyl glycosylphosphotransferase